MWSKLSPWNILLERSQSVDIEIEFTFSIWSCELGIEWPKEGCGVKLIIWFLTIKTQGTWVNRPLIEACNTSLKRS